MAGRKADFSMEKGRKYKVFLPENFTFWGKVIIIIRMDNYGY
jgi:hypothetical protein